MIEKLRSGEILLRSSDPIIDVMEDVNEFVSSTELK
jgi:hypothetical protein